ncbi:hypothetical protein CEUSTIGMA_g3165.t1 [Chlamydomonas eustigma]|uniref:Uncharacterized protein n=1 Tax=Chlamydomonas eustigma TaxID=1157962 RepID=A0A250WYN6_9CHLO|nr:hypothetical protein CEUSTIGMA_g3165.t1 [Chlamydomonas eustigma]|eukprot:GAX75722.1 hypothetical protein CEUSTIGMA_g3165.t1 [Chlamydomonas eustigma]
MDWNVVFSLFVYYGFTFLMSTGVHDANESPSSSDAVPAFVITGLALMALQVVQFMCRYFDLKKRYALESRIEYLTHQLIVTVQVGDIKDFGLVHSVTRWTMALLDCSLLLLTSDLPKAEKKQFQYLRSPEREDVLDEKADVRPLLCISRAMQAIRAGGQHKTATSQVLLSMQHLIQGLQETLISINGFNRNLSLSQWKLLRLFNAAWLLLLPICCRAHSWPCHSACVILSSLLIYLQHVAENIIYSCSFKCQPSKDMSNNCLNRCSQLLDSCLLSNAELIGPVTPNAANISSLGSNTEVREDQVVGPIRNSNKAKMATVFGPYTLQPKVDTEVASYIWQGREANIGGQQNGVIPAWRGLHAEAHACGLGLKQLKAGGDAGVRGIAWNVPSHSHGLFHGADVSINPIFENEDALSEGKTEAKAGSYRQTACSNFLPPSPLLGHCSENDSLQDTLSLNGSPLIRPKCHMGQRGVAEDRYVGPHLYGLSVTSSSSGRLWNGREDGSSTVMALKQSSGSRGHAASSASKTSNTLIMRSSLHTSKQDDECRTQ